MKKEELKQQQEKIEKKEWQTPQIVDFDVKDTEHGTHGFNDGGTNYSNIS